MNRAEETRQLASYLKKAQKGDQHALEEFFRETSRLLHDFFMNKYGDSDLVDDLQQEVFIDLLNHYKQIREPLKIRNYILRIATSTMRQHLRSKYQRSESRMLKNSDSTDMITETMWSSSDENPTAESMVNRLDLQEKLQELPQETREILLMRGEGYKFSEIAEIKGLKLSTVKMKALRGMEILKKIILFVTFLLFHAAMVVKG